MTPEEFKSNLLVRPEVIGTPSALTHFLANTSSQRRLMFDNAAAQVEVIKGNETARFQTGFETKFGKYEFDENVLAYISPLGGNYSGGYVEYLGYVHKFLFNGDDKIEISS